VWAQYEHVNAPAYVNGRVCIAGDAAHAMTPWQGSGAATAIEDAVVLGALFAQIRTSDVVGLDPVKMHDALVDRWGFIHDFDLDGHIKSAEAFLKNMS